ncbi:site-2 protease family protein [Paenibacillus sp. IB182496]|uniref:Site-2 protease family protein n=1 Tax=Paenibacillus sabuli TaxID=2772509 RepID=A0A927GTS5_9BACL|nr:site-2 protease family protein [Paenibacillus sabuli]MBD2847410.1 site-2 protease family protein [Paenibacillus sabuli]
MIGAALLFVVTKGKTLLLLLSKFAAPLVSMAITVGAYALLSPLWFAVGLVLLIFVHELGHVWAAKRKGVPVSAPLFIPFIGALITMKRHPKDAVTEAYIAMGGPLLGTLGALLVYAAGHAWELPLLFVLANVGFILNLFNLVPIHPLDGGRIAAAVGRWLWLLGLVGGLGLIVWLRSWLLLLIWALFAWELYQRYVSRRGNKPLSIVGVYELPLDRVQMPDWFMPSSTHTRELSYTTYCRLTGEQLVQFDWTAMRFRGELELPVPAIVQGVQLVGAEQVDKGGGALLRLKVRVDYVKHDNDRYYVVSAATRWTYGAAYAGLAVFLIGMIWHIQQAQLAPPIR